MAKIKIVCADCGSDDVRRDAYAAWSVEAQDWELSSVFDQGTCETCGDEASLEEVEIVEFANTHDADAEGWGIFDAGGSDGGRWKLCKVDDSDALANDDEAWRYVLQRAGEGSAYHQSALDFIRTHNPIEWVAFAAIHKRGETHANGAPMVDRSTGAMLEPDGSGTVDDDDEPVVIERFKTEGRADG